MATYLSGSNVQADAMQTLYLMNPSYAGYGDASNPGNMVLLNSTTGAMGHGSQLGNPGQQHQQQHYIGFSGLTQSGLSQQSNISPMSNSNMGHQNSPSNVFTSRHGYTWNGGNELSFLPSNVTEDSVSLAARLNSVNSGQQSPSGIPHYGIGNLSQSSLQEQVSLIPNGVALGLNMENLQPSPGAGQILSLSLSPQQPSMMQLQTFPIQHNDGAVNSCQGFSNAVVDNNSSKVERFPDKWGGSRESMLGSGFQNQLHGAGSNRQVNMMTNALTMEIYGSKYLKAAQELLNEVVSVRRGIKNGSSKHTKLQSWMGLGSTSDGFFTKDRNSTESSGKDGAPVVSWSIGKDGEPTVTTVPSTAAPAGPEPNAENAVELTPAERQELQMKKAKLMAMLDEVDQRYKQYYQEMQIVVASFESAAGLGAARTYTALALQTISKHFRCLRDAISSQIRASSRALGEEDISGQGRGETSRLRFVGQQLQQQRALQQLGMMQQHAWRPQRGLPERSVSILRAWLFEHFLHPYPKDADKILLARQTGLTRSQVSNWFINARVRLWKPMVEEMYLEETKEVGTDNSGRDGGENMNKGEGLIDGAGSSEMGRAAKQAKISDANNEGFPEANNAPDHASNILQTRNLTSSSSDSSLLHEKENMRQGIKKARNGLQDSASLLSPNSSTGRDYKSDEAHGEDALEHDIRIKTEDRFREQYSIPHSGMVQADHQNLGGYGSLHASGLNRYSQESVAARYAVNSGVSLTLGLQHCEELPLSGAQQHYAQGQGQLPTGRQQGGGGAPADYYMMNENAANHTSSYEAMNLQNRKRFATQIHRRDFVA